MKTKYRIILLSIVLLGITSGAVLWRGACARGLAALSEQFPLVAIPSIPTTGEYCMYRINKTICGAINTKISRDSYYQCSRERAPLVHSPTSVVLRVNELPECSDTLSDVPGDFLLESSGSSIIEDNGFAHYSGDLKITDFITQVVMFTGRMELFGRVGTHQGFEKCDELQHVEGWIVGEGQGKWSQYTLRAMISAEGSFPNSTIPSSPNSRITGAIIKAP